MLAIPALIKLIKVSMSMTLQLIFVIVGVFDLNFPHDIVYLGKFILALDLAVVQILLCLNAENIVSQKRWLEEDVIDRYDTEAVKYDRWHNLEQTLYTPLILANIVYKFESWMRNSVFCET